MIDFDHFWWISAIFNGFWYLFDLLIDSSSKTDKFDWKLDNFNSNLTLIGVLFCCLILTQMDFMVWNGCNGILNCGSIQDGLLPKLNSMPCLEIGRFYSSIGFNFKIFIWGCNIKMSTILRTINTIINNLINRQQ